MKQPKKYLLQRVDDPSVRIVATGYNSVKLITGFNNSTIVKLLYDGSAKNFWTIDEVEKDEE